MCQMGEMSDSIFISKYLTIVKLVIRCKLLIYE